MNAVQLYRPSVAQRQKEMLNLSLQKLEEASLSAQSSTKEEASLRMQEAQLISRFVAKARTVVPKGEVILNESNIDSVLLEDGDVINIPENIAGYGSWRSAVPERGELAEGYDHRGLHREMWWPDAEIG